MTDAAEQLLDLLKALNIPFDCLTHEPVHTIEDCILPGRMLNALVPKNYFLTTRNQKRFFLCLARPEARFRSADISRQAGSARLSFAPEAQLAALLNTYPGAVSPLGLAFDVQNRVELLVDAELIKSHRLAFHPCDNCCTVAMAAADFFDRFLPAVKHGFHTVEICDFLQ